MKRRQFDFIDVTFFFPPNYFPDQKWGPKPLTEQDASQLAEIARERVAMDGPRTQYFEHRRHVITLHIMSPRLVEFSIFRCTVSKIFSTNLDHAWCRHAACEPVADADTTRKNTVLPRR